MSEEIDSCAKPHSLDITDFKLARNLYKEIAIEEFDKPTTDNQEDIEYLKKYFITHNLIARNADKNLGFTIMDIEWYQKQMTKHLKCTKTYRKVNAFPQKDITHDLLQILRNTCITTKYKQSLINSILDHPIGQVPEIYLVPKIHKSPVSTRPVVPEHKAIIMPSSKFMDTILLPLVQKCSWILRSTGDLIQRLESNTINMTNPVIMSADVVSLFTNIHVKQGLAFMRQIMAKEGFKQEDINTYAKLLEWVFNNNYFTYRGQLYQQIHGTAMGTSCCPNFANLVLMKIEIDKIIDKPENPPISIYCRLIDDCYMVIENTDVSKWQNIFQNANTYLDFTFDCSNNETATVPMLDLETFLGQKYTKHRKIDFIGYRKPYNNNLYTAPDSYCPDNYKFSWITGENIRLIRNNDNETSYLSQLKEYTENLQKRGYQSNVVIKHLKHAYLDRSKLLTPKERAKDSLKILRIPNISGYDLIINALRVYINLTGLICSIPNYTPIVLRGRNLENIINESNKINLNDNTI